LNRQDGEANMDVKAAEDRLQILENLLNEAREEADGLRKRLMRYEKTILSTRLIMGHELKKPTTAISGYLELVTEDLENTDALKSLSYIQNAAEQCRLLNELNLFFLELLKLDSGEEFIGRAAVDVNSVIREIIRRIPPILNAEQRVKSNIDKNAEIIDFNPEAFKLVMLNLIENALVYSQSRTPVLIEAETVPEKRAGRNGQIVKIRIKDKGVGIPAEYLQKIFCPFVRLREDIAEGSGLGLTLVRSLVELNGGEVYIRSTQDEGTVVHVTIPAREEIEEVPPTLL